MGIRPAAVRGAAVVLASTLLVAACTGSDGAGPADPTESSPEVVGGEVIREFAAAWPVATSATYEGLVDEPWVAAREVSGHMDELGITETHVELENDLDCDDDSCRQHAEVTHQLAGVGEWSYGTVIEAGQE